MLQELHQLLQRRLLPKALQSAEAFTFIALCHFSRVFNLSFQQNKCHSEPGSRSNYSHNSGRCKERVDILPRGTIASYTIRQERKGERKQLNQHTVHPFILLCHLAYGHSCDQDSNWHFSQLIHLFSLCPLLQHQSFSKISGCNPLGE